MGFTHDTGFAQFIHPYTITPVGGSWSNDLTSNVVGRYRAAADGLCRILVPALVPSNSQLEKGSLLKSIELLYAVTTAALDEVSDANVSILKITYAAEGTPTGTAPACTINTAENTSAKRIEVRYHRLIATLTTPAYIDNDESYWLNVYMDAAATSVVWLYGGIANYTLRA